MVVNGSGFGSAQSIMWIQRVLACPMKMFGIRMTGECESRRQLANPVYLENGR